MQPEALEDLIFWVHEDRMITVKVLDPIDAARRGPFNPPPRFLGRPTPG